MIHFGTLEAGLANLVQSKLSLVAAAVLWVNQNVAEPPSSIHSWVTLKRGDLTRQGPIDGTWQYETPGTPGLGEEVTQRTQGPRGLPISIQAFSRASANGDSSAFSLLAQLQTIFSLPSTLAALGLLGVGVNKVGPVRDLSGLVNQAFQGRAILELQLNLVDSIEERIGYFIRVTGELQLGPNDTPTTIPFDSGTSP